MSYFSWRTVYLLSIGLRFVLALSNSYIHPDEHFQSFEVLAGRLFSLATNEPWEFESSSPARSFAPLLAVYYIPLKLAQWLALSPLQTWYLVRLVFMSISWVVTDYCLYKMLPTKQERVKAIYFVSTSFVSLVYQSHTFSNSIETVLVVLTVYLINELRFMKSLPQHQYTKSDVIYVSAAIGLTFAFGVFNRVTFPAYFIIPAIFYIQCAWKWPYIIFVSTSVLTIVSAACILVDTILFSDISFSVILQNPWEWSQYVVTPINNLVYNSKLENLAHHGLHPYYTHILINLPQIFGPGLILLLPRFRNSYWKTTPFVSAISGLLFLSLVPHQELRFLIPVVPLLCSCFDVASLESACKNYPRVLALVMNAWLAFNIIMAAIMGIFHQGGVVPALDYIHNNSVFNCPGTAIIWWRTYSPPTWMLEGKTETLQIVSLDDASVDSLSFDTSKNLSLDVMGMETGKVRKVVEQVSSKYDKVYVISPIASFKQSFDASLFEDIWNYNYHLDMDHLDFSNLQSLQPGLAIYSLL